MRPFQVSLESESRERVCSSLSSFAYVFLLFNLKVSQSGRTKWAKMKEKENKKMFFALFSLKLFFDVSYSMQRSPLSPTFE